MKQKADSSRKAVTVYLPADMYAKAQAAAADDDRTLSSYIKRCLAEALLREQKQ